MHSRFHDGLFEKLSHTYCHSRVLFSQFVAILLDLILVDVVLKFTSSYFLSQFLKYVFGKYLFVYSVLFLLRIKFYIMLFSFLVGTQHYSLPIIGVLKLRPARLS